MEVLKKHRIKQSSWELFVKIAQDNLMLSDERAPYYIGGMKDALWAWIGGVEHREVFNVLEHELELKLAEKKIEVEQEKKALPKKPEFNHVPLKGRS